MLAHSDSAEGPGAQLFAHGVGVGDVFDRLEALGGLEAKDTLLVLVDLLLFLHALFPDDLLSVHQIYRFF